MKTFIQVINTFTAFSNFLSFLSSPEFSYKNNKAKIVKDLNFFSRQEMHCTLTIEESPLFHKMETSLYKQVAVYLKNSSPEFPLWWEVAYLAEKILRTSILRFEGTVYGTLVVGAWHRSILNGEEATFYVTVTPPKSLPDDIQEHFMEIQNQAQEAFDNSQEGYAIRECLADKHSWMYKAYQDILKDGGRVWEMVYGLVGDIPYLKGAAPSFRMRPTHDGDVEEVCREIRVYTESSDGGFNCNTELDW